MDTAYQFLGHLGLVGIFLGTIIEAMGVPFPGGLMLVLAGVLVGEGRINFIAAAAMAVIGFNLGGVTAYVIGRTMGEPFFQRFERVFKINHTKLERARDWMKQSSAAFIILGRFVPMASNLTPYLAGMSRLGPVKFLIYNSIFAIGWSILYIALGYYFSQNWQALTSFIQTRLPYVAGAALLVYLGAALLIRRKI